MTVVLVIEMFSVMICIFGWRWKVIEKKVSNWITIFLRNRVAFLLATGAHSSSFAKFGGKGKEQNKDFRGGRMQISGLVPWALSLSICTSSLQCEWNSAHTAYWFTPLMSPLFYVKSEAGAHLPEWEVKERGTHKHQDIRTQHPAWHGAGAPVFLPPLSSPWPSAQAAVIYEYTTGEMKQFALVGKTKEENLECV